MRSYLNNSILILFVSCFLIASLNSCKGTKGDSAKPKKSEIKKVKAKLAELDADYNTFSAKTKMKYNDGNKTQSFGATIRMQKDSVVWMALTGPFGIEGGRVLVTQDSLKIINRLNRQYYIKPIEYIQEYIAYPLGLHELQTLILGRLVQPVGKTSKVIIDGRNYYIDNSDEFIEDGIWLNPENYTVEKNRLKDKVSKIILLSTFEDYEEVEEITFSKKRSIEIQNEEVVSNLSIDFNKVKFNEALNYPFSINSKYEKVE